VSSFIIAEKPNPSVRSHILRTIYGSVTCFRLSEKRVFGISDMTVQLRGSRSVFYVLFSCILEGLVFTPMNEPIACHCFCVACQQWTLQSNTNYGNGLGNPAANVAQCQAACRSNPACIGFDWDARQPVTVGRQCWLSGSWSGARGIIAGVTHYVINRNCLGKSKHLVCINTETSWLNVILYSASA